jgi:small redox-active disulfide protein 2
MNIQVLGSGCPNCKKLYEQTLQAVKDLALDSNVEYITDIQKIVELGVMASPVLAINGKPVLVGLTFDLDKLKQIILANK